MKGVTKVTKEDVEKAKEAAVYAADALASTAKAAWDKYIKLKREYEKNEL